MKRKFYSQAFASSFLNVFLRRRGLLQNDIQCVGGCGCAETTVHLACDIFGSTWYILCRWLGIDFVPAWDIGEHFDQFSQLAGMSRSSHLFFRIIWLDYVWVIWKERNNRIFKNVAFDPSTLSDKVKLNFFLWLKAKKPSVGFCYHDWCRHLLLCNFLILRFLVLFYEVPTLTLYLVEWFFFSTPCAGWTTVGLISYSILIC